MDKQEIDEFIKDLENLCKKHKIEMWADDYGESVKFIYYQKLEDDVCYPDILRLPSLLP